MASNECVMRSYGNNTMKISFFSTIGDRDEQQDRFGCSLHKDDGIIVVCDGMGGYEHGAEAAELTVNVLCAVFYGAKEEYDPVSLMVNCAVECDSSISQMCTDDGQKIRSGCTLVSLIVRNRQLYWCSVGDSRAYLKRSGEFVQFTLDHNYRTVIDEKLRTGELDMEEYEHELKRGEALISYIGIGNLGLIDYNSSPIELESGDRLIIMSDGLYRFLSDGEIHDCLEKYADAAEALRKLEELVQISAKERNASRDNMTVALIDIL